MAKVLNKTYSMNICRTIVSILSLYFFSTPALATELSRCLSTTSHQEHRLEKEDTILHCFNQYKKTLSYEGCSAALAKVKSKMSSTKLTEEIKSICFYETTTSKDMNSCMARTKLFKNSSNHDEAIFYCYLQYQNRMTKSDCNKTANKLIFPLKKAYLKQHCDTYN